VTDLVVRRARAADFDAVAALTVAEVLVADLDGEVVGAVTWCPSGSLWREIAEDDEGEFRTLAVTAGGRGRGVGEALVEADWSPQPELELLAFRLRF
jgi:N-acetylglutamate synthase-like GNAT family acetyltransferase